jgi:hypothetical protein
MPYYAGQVPLGSGSFPVSCDYNNNIKNVLVLSLVRKSFRNLEDRGIMGFSGE